MQLFDPNNPNEKKKIIVAAVLGLVAIIVLGYLFFGGSTKAPANRPVAKPSPTPVKTAKANVPGDTGEEFDPAMFIPIPINWSIPQVPEADRNIFSYYVPPPPVVRPSPPPTPAPTPPLNVSSLSPQSVYARTSDFSLQVVGDKFTPAVKIVVDGRALPTRFISAQQLATNISADQITNPGNRMVVVKSPDGLLYSNSVYLTVTPPPLPNYNYIGLIGKPRFNDTAVLQDKNSKDLLNVVRGDVVGGRFRVNSISEKEVVLIDTDLKIRHTLTFTVDPSNSSRPAVRRNTVDDEP